MSYVSDSQDTFLLFLVVILVIFSWLSERTRIGEFLSGTIVIMLLGIVLSNSNILPTKAFMYDQVAIYSVPFAIPLLLLNANMKTIFKESGITMLAFLLACLGTCLGAVVGYFLIDMGNLGNLWTGVFAASYTGGTINFVSVSSALSLPESGIAAAVAADTVVGITYLFVLTGLSRSKVLMRWLSFDHSPPLQHRNFESASEEVDKVHCLGETGKLCLVLSISVGIYLFSREIAAIFELEQYTILIVTVFSIMVANVIPHSIANAKGAFRVGTLLMYGFFFVIAVGTDLQILLNSAGSFSKFLLILLAVHLVVIFVVAKLLKIGLPELAIASCACVIGPSVAAALAANRDWVALITPAILCGTLGYAIGNLIGLSLAYVLP